MALSFLRFLIFMALAALFLAFTFSFMARPPKG